MPQGLRLVGILLLAAMLSGCVTEPVAEWGVNGLTVKMDEEVGTATIWDNPRESPSEDQQTVNLIGCDNNHVIPQTDGDINRTSHKEKVHIEGWLAASKNFPDGFEGEDIGGAERVSAASVIIRMTEYDNAKQSENGRLTITNWDYPTLGIKARPPGYMKSSDFPHPQWSVVGLVPGNENVLEGFAALDWNQKISLEGWLMHDNNSSNGWYPIEVRATDDGDCRIFAGIENNGFSGSMLVTSIRLENHGTIDNDHSYNAYKVRFLGSAGYMLLLMAAVAGAFVLFVGSTGMIRTGARWSAKRMLSEAQMVAAKGIRRELKDAKATIEEATGTEMDLDKPDVEKREKLSKLDQESDIEFEGFDVGGALKSQRTDPRTLGTGQGGGGVTSTPEADELDTELAELQDDLAAQRDNEMLAKKGGRRGVSVPDTQASEVQAEPEKARKTRRKRKVKEAKPEEPEPEPEKPKRQGPSVGEDDDFTDFSL